MKKKKESVARMLRIKTTLDFGEEAPLERLGEIAKALREHHVDTVSGATHGFVPIAFDCYMDLHMQSNPSIDGEEFVGRLRHAVDARKAGTRCRWSLHLGDRIGRSRGCMLHLHYGQPGAAGQRV